MEIDWSTLANVVTGAGVAFFSFVYHRLDKRFDKIDARFEKSDSRIDSRFDKIEDALREIKNSIAGIGTRVTTLEVRMEERGPAYSKRHIVEDFYENSPRYSSTTLNANGNPIIRRKRRKLLPEKGA